MDPIAAGEWLRPALLHGLGLSLALTAVVLLSLRQDPRIWQHDAPRALQEALGPEPPATLRRRRVWATIVGATIVATSVSLCVALAGLPGGDTFVVRALAAGVAFELFNLYDAIVLDVVVIILWAPRWAFTPGTRRHPSLLDPRFHLRAFATGLVAGVPFALAVAGAAAAIDALRGL